MAAVLNPDKWLHRLIGRKRLLHGYCPRCNSDAPAVDKCTVCKQIHIVGQGLTYKNLRQQYPPNRATKALWWYTWMHPKFELIQEKYLNVVSENKAM